MNKNEKKKKKMNTFFFFCELDFSWRTADRHTRENRFHFQKEIDTNIQSVTNVSRMLMCFRMWANG